jgi:competence ComEA-like helix-hairpin-helix protein
MWKRSLFFWFERLDITVAERRSLLVLTLLAIGLHSAKPWFIPEPRYDAAFYAPLMAAFDSADARPDPEAERMRINTATAADFESLPGIGPALAGRIIAYREEHGPFASVEDLMNVKGIGPKLMERIRPHVQ